MKQFDYLTKEETEHLFFSPPIDFNNHTDKDLLAHAIGAALYMPATRQTIAEDVLTRKHEGLASIVIDLEDAVGDLQIELAEETLIQQLDRIEYYVMTGELSIDHVPLLFIPRPLSGSVKADDLTDGRNEVTYNRICPS